MSDKLFLNMKEDHVVLFADILGFSEAVKKNESVTIHDKGGIIVNFPRIYQIFVETYSKEYQEHLGIKLLWVSDSVIVSAPIANVDAIFFVLNDFTNQMYCSGLPLRGVITVGKLYHEDNVWGPALVEAVEDEKNRAKYPRVILKKEYVDKLSINPQYRQYIVESDIEDYCQYEFLDQSMDDFKNRGADMTASLSVYSQFVGRQYKENALPSVKEKYKWLAKKLLDTVNRHSSYIDEYVSANEKWSTISGKAERLVSHVPFKVYLEEIIQDGVIL